MRRPHRLLVTTTLYGMAAGVCLAVGVYCLAGVVQALLVFSGDRLMTNMRLWLPLCVFFLGFGSWLGYKTLKQSLMGRDQ